MAVTSHTPTVFILGLSSDIGREMALRFAHQGWRVAGTYRQGKGLEALAETKGVAAIPCDAGDPYSIAMALDEYAALDAPWDLFLSSIGTMEPIGPFFDLDFGDWEKSVTVNSTAQLRMLHGLYPLRRQGDISHAMFFAGMGTNNVTSNYSAYIASKIMLIKMCEQLDAEAPDLNVFIIGPGFIPTKIIQETVRAGDRAGENLQKTLDFLDNPGTNLNDVFTHITWCMEQGREVAGGRNFSSVHDPWRNGGEQLAGDLKADKDMFKLRRCGSGGGQ
jgi:NAD(P)-dependent dehydrogenase (short-subunit alcohol dehydrogenase family)